GLAALLPQVVAERADRLHLHHSSVLAKVSTRKLGASDRGHRPFRVARISPTGSPPPKTGAVRCASSTGAVTPSRRSAAAITTGRARWLPSSSLSATAVPSGSPTA